MKTNDRIRLIRKQLCNNSNIEFANRVGSKPNQTSNWINSDKDVGKKVLDKISEAFPEINSAWIYKGEGPMLKESVEPPSKVATVADLMETYKGHQSDVRKLLGKDYANVPLSELTEEQQEKLSVALGANYDDMITGIEALKRETSGKLVPVYDAKAAAGTEGVSIVPAYRDGWVNVGDLLKDSESAMTVYGNSMLPGYPSGCMIGLREVKDGLIDPGSVYVIETEDNRYVKRLYYNADHTAYRCVSDNKIKHTEGDMTGEWFYPTFEIPFDKVHKVFAVTGVIKRNRHL